MHYKNINIFDVIRYVYHQFMIHSGIADTYRYEQFIKKNDILYNLELLLIYSNMNRANKEILFEYLITIGIYLLIIAKKS